VYKEGFFHLQILSILPSLGRRLLLKWCSARYTWYELYTDYLIIIVFLHWSIIRRCWQPTTRDDERDTGAQLDSISRWSGGVRVIRELSTVNLPHRYDNTKNYHHYFHFIINRLRWKRRNDPGTKFTRWLSRCSQPLCFVKRFFTRHTRTHCFIFDQLVLMIIHTC